MQCHPAHCGARHSAASGATPHPAALAVLAGSCRSKAARRGPAAPAACAAGGVPHTRRAAHHAASAASSSSSSTTSGGPAGNEPAGGSGGPLPPDLPALAARLDELLARAEREQQQRSQDKGQQATSQFVGSPLQQQARGPGQVNPESEAVALVEEARAAGLLRGFGAARMLPKRDYTLDELRLNRIEPSSLLSPKDNSLSKVRTIAQVSAGLGLGAWAVVNDYDPGHLLALIFGVVFALVADQVANGGGGEALAVDSLGRLLVRSYGPRVSYHESGHLLVAYLVGLLPKAYTLSSLDAFVRYRALNIQAGCTFCDAQFGAEVATGKLRSSSIEKYTCVALAGVVTEYLRFEVAEGGLGDVQQLDALFRALQFSQRKADSEVRWAVLSVAALLRRHARLHDELAAAMGRGMSVGQCVRLIEERLAACDDI